MVFHILANLVLLIHLLFLAFVFLGAFLVRRYHWLAWLHLPAVTWAGVVEFTGWYCPLTPLENWFLQLGGEAGYSGGFVETHLLSVIYPDGLTRSIQIALGCLVVLINVLLYAYILRDAARKRRAG